MNVKHAGREESVGMNDCLVTDKISYAKLMWRLVSLPMDQRDFSNECVISMSFSAGFMENEDVLNTGNIVVPVTLIAQHWEPVIEKWIAVWNSLG